MLYFLRVIIYKKTENLLLQLWSY